MTRVISLERSHGYFEDTRHYSDKSNMIFVSVLPVGIEPTTFGF